jgi:hypothetical protein
MLLRLLYTTGGIQIKWEHHVKLRNMRVYSWAVVLLTDTLQKYAKRWQTTKLTGFHFVVLHHFRANREFSAYSVTLRLPYTVCELLSCECFRAEDILQAKGDYPWSFFMDQADFIGWSHQLKRVSQHSKSIQSCLSFLSQTPLQWGSCQYFWRFILIDWLFTILRPAQEFFTLFIIYHNINRTI